MTFKHKVNQGSAFRNESKEAETHADFTGSANIAGVEYWVNIWSNPAKEGKKGFFNIRFKLKDTLPEQGDF